ncbi:MAG: hypothetical protein KC431_15190, partial [Myxococcales bacterium]|nr:hypothetical protein [Myxococcales bacterium]
MEAQRERLEAAGKAGDRVATLLPELTRATWLSMTIEQGVGAESTHAREAGRLWLRLYGHTRGGLGQARDPVAVGLAAVMPLLAHLDDPSSDSRDAGLAFGLARELEPRYSHTAVRRLAFIAALRSDWSRLDHSENNAGFERLELPVAEVEPTPEAAVREAMLVVPWSENQAREILTPGRKGVLAWDAAPGSVEAEIWCRAGRPDLSPSRAELVTNPRALGTASLSLRLRGGPDNAVVAQEQLEVGDAVLSRVRLAVVDDDRHQLEVVLSDDPIWACAWRGVGHPGQGVDATGSGGKDLQPRRRARWWTADPDRPVEFVILGPASVNLESRAIGAGDSGTAALLEVSAQPLGDLRGRGLSPGLSPETAEGSLALATTIEESVITETRRRFVVTEAVGHTLLLTEPVAYRVRIASDRGRALVRARIRRDRDDLPPPARVSLRELRGAPLEPESLLDWRGVGPAMAIAAGEPDRPVANRIGTLDGRVRAGLD